MLSLVKRLVAQRAVHPLDRVYNIRTSGRVPHHQLRTGDPAVDAANIGYVGSQPSVIRASFQALGDVTDFTLYDLGCGKGRVLAVATEFPFRSIMGLELSPALVRHARANCEQLARAFPTRVRAEVLEADATRPQLPPAGDVVIFLYNPFRRPLVESLLSHLGAAITATPNRRIWVVYYNPVHAAVFDESRQFVRHFADMLPHTPDEAAAHPFINDFDTVVIWRTPAGDYPGPFPGAEREVVVTVPDLAAELSPRC